jgi:hypothetical protein
MPTDISLVKSSDKTCKESTRSNATTKSKRIQLPIKLASIIKSSVPVGLEGDLSEAVRGIETTNRRELSSYLRVVCMRTGLTP